MIIQKKNTGSPFTSEEFQMSTLSAAGPENFHDVHRHNFFEIIWFRKCMKAVI
jgi:hypothetical protein